MHPAVPLNLHPLLWVSQPELSVAVTLSAQNLSVQGVLAVAPVSTYQHFYVNAWHVVLSPEYLLQAEPGATHPFLFDKHPCKNPPQRLSVS